MTLTTLLIMETINLPQSASSRNDISITRYETRNLIILVLVAFIIRLSSMLYFKTYIFDSEDMRVGSEMGWIASQIAAGEGFKLGDNFTAWMAPVYPYILAAIYRVFDYASIRSTIAILVLQSFISALIVIPLYIVGKRIFNLQVGLLAAGLWIIHPASIMISTSSIWSTNLTSLGLILIIVLFLWLQDSSNGTLLAIAVGLVIGITALSDPVILLTTPFLALWLYWRSKSDKPRRIKQITIVAITAILIIFPWTLRNYFVFDQFVPIKANFGINLWLGNHKAHVNQPTAGFGFWNKLEAEYDEQDTAYLTSLNEAELDKIMLQRAMDFIAKNPAVFAKYSLYRTYLFWRITQPERTTIFDRILLFLPIATFVGIVLSRRYWKDTILLLSIFLSYPLIYLITHMDRAVYRFPIEPLMLVFLSFLLYESLMIVRQFREKL